MLAEEISQRRFWEVSIQKPGRWRPSEETAAHAYRSSATEVAARAVGGFTWAAATTGPGAA